MGDRGADTNQEGEALPHAGWPRTCPGDPTPARERKTRSDPSGSWEEDRDRDREGGRVGKWGTDILVKEVAVDGPVECVLERAAVEQTHPFLLRRPPRQVPRRRRHRPRRRRRCCSFPSLLSPLASVVGFGDWDRIRTGHGRADLYGLFGLLDLATFFFGNCHTLTHCSNITESPLGPILILNRKGPFGVPYNSSLTFTLHPQNRYLRSLIYLSNLFIIGKIN